MPNPDKTSIIVVLDRSGSMSSIKKATIEGFNSLLRDQKKQPGTRLLTMVQFDQHGAEPTTEIVHFEKAIVEVPRLMNLTFVPRGGTPLLDAMGSTIATMGAHFANQLERERPGHVIFVTITDGEENSSREYTRDKVFEMVRHQTEKYSWNFVYVGANQDAIKAAANLGIPQGAALFYAANSAAVGNTFDNVSSYVIRSSKGMTGQSLHFTDQERRSSVVGSLVSPPASVILSGNPAKDTSGGQ